MQTDSTPVPPEQGDAAGPDEERVEIDDPFEIPPEVEEAWDDEEAHEGEAPTG